jgi:hypothetical protein
MCAAHVERVARLTSEAQELAAREIRRVWILRSRRRIDRSVASCKHERAMT